MAQKKRINIGAVIGIIFAVAFILMFLLFFAGMFSLMFGVETIQTGNVAVIPVKGIIIVEDGQSFFGQNTASSEWIVKQIEKAEKDKDIKAIVLDINSGGGSPVATDEIANAVKKANKTTIALIREVGASGAYWVASACDIIYANRMSLTGSIGVLGSYIEFAELMEKYNMTYRRLVSGKYKDIGSPLKEMTEEEQELLQSYVDELHQVFIQEVANNRNIPIQSLRTIATGMFYSGQKAKDLGLIDALGSKDDVKKYIEEQMNITVEFAEYKKKKTFFDVIAKAFNEHSFFMGKGFGSALFDVENEGVLV